MERIVEHSLVALDYDGSVSSEMPCPTVNLTLIGLRKVSVTSRSPACRSCIVRVGVTSVPTTVAGVTLRLANIF